MVVVRNMYHYATLKRARSLRWKVVRSVEGVILFQYQSACGSTVDTNLRNTGFIEYEIHLAIVFSQTE